MPTHPSIAHSLLLLPRPACEPPPPPSLWPAWALLMMATRLCLACLATGLLLGALLVAPRPGCPVGPLKVRRLQESTITPKQDWKWVLAQGRGKLKAGLLLPLICPSSQGLPYPRTAEEQSGAGCSPVAYDSQCGSGHLCKATFWETMGFGKIRLPRNSLEVAL